MSTISGIIVILIFLIVVPVLAVAGSYHYIKSHIFITDGPVGNVKSYCSVFLEFLIGGWIAAALILEFVELFIDFVMEHWKWFAGGGAIIIALLIIGTNSSNDTNKRETDNKDSPSKEAREQTSSYENKKEDKESNINSDNKEKSSTEIKDLPAIKNNNLQSKVPPSTEQLNLSKTVITNFCTNCGSKLDVEDKFCRNCGKPIN